LQRLLVGHAHELDMDTAGRILLPPMLRQFAGLEKNVVLVGQGAKLEMWNEERWQNEVDQALAFNNGLMPPELEGFTL
jgi:MraZ protein